jgi:hypothetical protein
VIQTEEPNLSAVDAVRLYEELSEVERPFANLKDVIAGTKFRKSTAARALDSDWLIKGLLGWPRNSRGGTNGTTESRPLWPFAIDLDQGTAPSKQLQLTLRPSVARR